MLKLRNKEVKCFNLGGGAEKKMTCDEAATRFVEEILGKDLSTSSVRFPEEKLSIGKIPVPLQSEEEYMEKAEEILDPKKIQAFKIYWSQYFGDKAEFKVWEYLKRIPETPPTALLHNFDLKMFLLFTAKPDDEAVSKPAKPAAKPGDKASDIHSPGALPYKRSSPGAVAADKPSPGAVEADEPSPDAVAANKPSPDAVTADKPSPGAVAADKPSPGAVAADKPSPGAVVADEPSPDALAADKPRPDAVTADKPSPGAVAADKPKAKPKKTKEKNLEELENQEWDFFLLSSEYKAFIHIEVKAGKVSEFSNILLLL